MVGRKISYLVNLHNLCRGSAGVSTGLIVNIIHPPLRFAGNAAAYVDPLPPTPHTHLGGLPVTLQAMLTSSPSPLPSPHSPRRVAGNAAGDIDPLPTTLSLSPPFPHSPRRVAGNAAGDIDPLPPPHSHHRWNIVGADRRI